MGINIADMWVKPICKWYMLGSPEDEHSCDEVLKAGRYVVDEGKKLWSGWQNNPWTFFWIYQANVAPSYLFVTCENYMIAVPH